MMETVQVTLRGAGRKPEVLPTAAFCQGNEDEKGDGWVIPVREGDMFRPFYMKEDTPY